MSDPHWLGIVQGNSRHHWGWFTGNHLDYVNSFNVDQAPPLPPDTEIWLARVAGPEPPARILLQQVQLAGIAIPGLYATLGVDRALALWAAGSDYGWPVLVIDGGTALTFTGADDQGCFGGGAILPGLGLQARSLSQGTEALPEVSWTGSFALPPRWSRTTAAAIASGILYSVWAGLQDFMGDWIRHYPHSRVVFTGGDGALLHRLVTDPEWQKEPIFKGPCYLELNLVLLGIAVYRAHQIRQGLSTPTDPH